jgi:antimicrobial peptide system SdpA family protein
MRPNPIALPLEDVNVVRTFLPEGWGFFTKNAEEENPFFYARVGGEWVPAIQESPYSLRYLLGANRTGRYRGVEMGLVIAAAGKTAWTNCDTDPLTCLGTLTPLVIGPVREGTLCVELDRANALVVWAGALSPPNGAPSGKGDCPRDSSRKVGGTSRRREPVDQRLWFGTDASRGGYARDLGGNAVRSSLSASGWRCPPARVQWPASDQRVLPCSSGAFRRGALACGARAAGRR